MRAIDIETTTVRQDFIELPIVIRSRPFPLTIDLKPARIQQGIFVLVVPHRMRSRKIRALAAEVNGVGHRVGRSRVTTRDTDFGLRADDTGRIVRRIVAHEISRYR